MNTLNNALERLEKAAGLQKVSSEGDKYEVEMTVEYENNKIFWEVDISALRMKLLTNPKGYTFSMSRLHDGIEYTQERLKIKYKTIVKSIATSGKGLTIEGKQKKPFHIKDNPEMKIKDDRIFLVNGKWGFTAMMYGFASSAVGEEETIQILKDAVQNALGTSGGDIEFTIN